MFDGAALGGVEVGEEINRLGHGAVFLSPSLSVKGTVSGEGLGRYGGILLEGAVSQQKKETLAMASLPSICIPSSIYLVFSMLLLPVKLER